MSEAEKNYPLNLAGIKEIGKETWLANYQPAFPGQKFQNIYAETLNAYALAMEQVKENSTVYCSCVVNYKIFIIIANFYYRFLAMVELQKKGFTKVLQNGSITVEQAVEQARDVGYLINEYKPISSKTILRERVRYVKQNVKTHGIFKSLFGNCGGNICVIGDPEDPYLKSYFKINKYTPEYIRSFLYLAGATEDISEKDSADVDKFSDYFVRKMRETSSQDYFDNRFFVEFKKLYKHTVALFNHVSRKIGNRDLPPLIVDSIHYNYSRILSGVWHCKRGKVIALAHGNSYLTGVKAGPLANGSLTICDTFLIPSIGEKMQLEYGKSVEESKLMSAAELVLHSSVKLKTIYEKEKKYPEVKSIKKIMVVGCPMDFSFYPGLPGHDTLTDTHLTVKILQTLRKAGYFISYKAHPETLDETIDFFDEYVDEIRGENFSEVYHEADCLLYINQYTTTFGVGMLTNIPIVFVDNIDWQLWHPEIKPWLDKRAVGFEVKSDAQGVVRFVKDNLAECIEESLNRLDHTVVEKFAF